MYEHESQEGKRKLKELDARINRMRHLMSLNHLGKLHTDPKAREELEKITRELEEEIGKTQLAVWIPRFEDN